MLRVTLVPSLVLRMVQARIYNVGILSGSVGGSGNTGGLVGYLDGTGFALSIAIVMLTSLEVQQLVASWDIIM